MGNTAGFMLKWTERTLQDNEQGDVVAFSVASFENNAIDFTLSHIDVDHIDEEVQTENVEKSASVRELIASAMSGKVLFEALSDHQVEDLIEKFVPMKCSAGDIIINHGDTGDYM